MYEQSVVHHVFYRCHAHPPIFAVFRFQFHAGCDAGGHGGGTGGKGGSGSRITFAVLQIRLPGEPHGPRGRQEGFVIFLAPANRKNVFAVGVNPEVVDIRVAVKVKFDSVTHDIHDGHDAEEALVLRVDGL